MKSDLELAVEASKKLETLLSQNYSATGRGLHEKLDSVAGLFRPEVIRDARFIATIRNKIVHEGDTYKIDDRNRFCKILDRLVIEFSSHPRSSDLEIIDVSSSSLDNQTYFPVDIPERNEKRTAGMLQNTLELLFSHEPTWLDFLGALIGLILGFCMAASEDWIFPVGILVAFLGAVIGAFWRYILFGIILISIIGGVFYCLYLIYSSIAP